MYPTHLFPRYKPPSRSNHHVYLSTTLAYYYLVPMSMTHVVHTYAMLHTTAITTHLSASYSVATNCTFSIPYFFVIHFFIFWLAFPSLVQSPSLFPFFFDNGLETPDI